MLVKEASGLLRDELPRSPPKLLPLLIMLVLLISFSSLSIMYTIIMLNTAIVMLQETEEKQT